MRRDAHGGHRGDRRDHAMFHRDGRHAERHDRSVGAFCGDWNGIPIATAIKAITVIMNTTAITATMNVTPTCAAGTRAMPAAAAGCQAALAVAAAMPTTISAATAVAGRADAACRPKTCN